MHTDTKAKELIMKKPRVHCVPCEGIIKPLALFEINEYLKDFRDWHLIEISSYKIERIFTFNNFIDAMHFVNALAEVAEQEGHHPDIIIHYNVVTIQIYTHAINGLSANDFILAGLIDDVYTEKPWHSL